MLAYLDGNPDARTCRHQWATGTYQLVDKKVPARICNKCGAAQWHPRSEKQWRWLGRSDINIGDNPEYCPTCDREFENK